MPDRDFQESFELDYCDFSAASLKERTQVEMRRSQYRAGLFLLMIVPVVMLTFRKSPSWESIALSNIAVGACLLATLLPAFFRFQRQLFPAVALLCGVLFLINGASDASFYIPIVSFYLVWLYFFSQLSAIGCLSIGVVISTIGYVAFLHAGDRSTDVSSLVTLDVINVFLLFGRIHFDKRLVYQDIQIKHLGYELGLDEVTHLLRRENLISKLKVQLSLPTAYPFQHSLILISLHDLKKVNTLGGLSAGNEMLKYFASALRILVIAPGFVGRFGSNQLLMYVPETNLAMANMMAHRFVHYMKRHPMQIGGQEVELTFSIGVLSLSLPVVELDAPLQALTSLADTARCKGNYSIASDDFRKSEEIAMGSDMTVEME